MNLAYPKPEKRKKKRGHKFSIATRTKIFQRDNYRCIIEGCLFLDITAHHVRFSYKDKIYDYKKANSIENGVTLCMTHHQQLHNYSKELDDFCHNYIHNLYGNKTMAREDHHGKNREDC